MKSKITVHPLTSADPESPLMVAALIGDGYGFLIGERVEAEALLAALTRYLERGKHDGPIDEMDERLGWAHIDIADAVTLANDVGAAVSAPVIRAACGAGKIRGAQKDGKTWRFARPRFLGWLRTRTH